VQGQNDFLKNILMRKRLKIENQLIFCEVGSIAGQGVMRIYVESSVKKNLTFLRSKISKKVKEQKDFSTLFFRKKRPQLFESVVFFTNFLYFEVSKNRR